MPNPSVMQVTGSVLPSYVLASAETAKIKVNTWAGPESISEPQAAEQAEQSSRLWGCASRICNLSKTCFQNAVANVKNTATKVGNFLSRPEVVATVMVASAIVTGIEAREGELSSDGTTIDYEHKATTYAAMLTLGYTFQQLVINYAPDEDEEPVAQQEEPVDQQSIELSEISVKKTSPDTDSPNTNSKSDESPKNTPKSASAPTTPQLGAVDDNVHERALPIELTLPSQQKAEETKPTRDIESQIDESKVEVITTKSRARKVAEYVSSKVLYVEECYAHPLNSISAVVFSLNPIVGTPLVCVAAGMYVRNKVEEIKQKVLHKPAEKIIPYLSNKHGITMEEYNGFMQQFNFDLNGTNARGFTPIATCIQDENYKMLNLLKDLKVSLEEPEAQLTSRQFITKVACEVAIFSAGLIATTVLMKTKGTGPYLPDENYEEEFVGSDLTNNTDLNSTSTATDETDFTSNSIAITHSTKMFDMATAVATSTATMISNYADELIQSISFANVERSKKAAIQKQNFKAILPRSVSKFLEENNSTTIDSGDNSQNTTNTDTEETYWDEEFPEPSIWSYDPSIGYTFLLEVIGVAGMARGVGYGTSKVLNKLIKKLETSSYSGAPLKIVKLVNFLISNSAITTGTGFVLYNYSYTLIDYRLALYGMGLMGLSNGVNVNLLENAVFDHGYNKKAISLPQRVERALKDYPKLLEITKFAKNNFWTAAWIAFACEEADPKSYRATVLITAGLLTYYTRMGSRRILSSKNENFITKKMKGISEQALLFGDRNQQLLISSAFWMTTNLYGPWGLIPFGVAIATSQDNILNGKRHRLAATPGFVKTGLLF